MATQGFRGRPVRREPPPPRGDAPGLALNYPIPGDTLAAWRASGKQCRNPGLLFERYIGYLSGWRLDDKRTSPKKDALEQIRLARVDEKLLQAYTTRWRETVGEAIILEGTPQWRFLTGLGRKGPLEVGFTFHRLYGFPIIPGSSLKGLAHAHAVLVEKLDENDGRLLSVFGSQKAQGKAVFYDAIPIEPPALELDVMNPHYPDYYQGKEPPANWQSPQPVFFLTLGAKSRFWFAVGGENTEAKELAAKWLQASLESLGVGAKTSAGYGFWKVKPIK